MDYNIIDISAGLAHNAAIGIDKNNQNYYEETNTKSNHILFTWGRGKEGRLGVGNQEDCTSPMKVPFFDELQIKEVYCGYSHTAVLTCKNMIFN